jgi:hypothetical protein
MNREYHPIGETQQEFPPGFSHEISKRKKSVAKRTLLFEKHSPLLSYFTLSSVSVGPTISVIYSSILILHYIKSIANLP